MSFYTSNAYLSIKEFWSEPDIYEDVIDGISVYARRNSSKAWCGYIRVPLTHIKADTANVLECHGGVTWDSDRAPWMKEPDGYFWYGFDCNHAWDLTPYDVFKEAVEQESWRDDYRYRTLRYVKEQLALMVATLSAVPEDSE